MTEDVSSVKLGEFKVVKETMSLNWIFKKKSWLTAHIITILFHQHEQERIDDHTSFSDLRLVATRPNYLLEFKDSIQNLFRSKISSYKKWRKTLMWGMRDLFSKVLSKHQKDK